MATSSERNQWHEDAETLARKMWEDLGQDEREALARVAHPVELNGIDPELDALVRVKLAELKPTGPTSVKALQYVRSGWGDFVIECGRKRVRR
jgi:hypothetical protein